MTCEHWKFEYDRMMALMPRKAIYSFDVRLLAMLFARDACALRSTKSGGGYPQKSSLARPRYPFANSF
jgi:hypothetical protein